MKILIIGGYGTFGGRLAHLLADNERLTLLIAGRSKQKAEAFCNQLLSKANKAALFFDRDGDVESQIREIAPTLVVDATGPFQIYGDDPYRVIKACITNGIDYVDLADGTEFVRNVGRFDQAAKAKNIFVLSGVSSLPVLSAAVVRRLSRDLSKINSITAGIAP
jgi:saccharopine dehydrogenase-like NADP-dependent oxidoreductase